MWNSLLFLVFSPRVIMFKKTLIAREKGKKKDKIKPEWKLVWQKE